MKRSVSLVLGFNEACMRAARLCSVSEHCVWEIERKLRQWGVSQTDADRVIDRLVELKYIDEERFARAYCNDRMRLSHWGRVKITAMLRGMHIPTAAIQAGIEQLDEQEYREVLGYIISQKDKTLSETDPYKRRIKLMRFAAGRGFELEEICNFLPED